MVSLSGAKLKRTIFYGWIYVLLPVGTIILLFIHLHLVSEHLDRLNVLKAGDGERFPVEGRSLPGGQSGMGGVRNDYCTQFHFYVDVSRVPVCRKPAVSIVYVTKRPGGYDILFNSLNEQTVKDYELIIVDELASYRSTKVLGYAEKMGIPIVDVVPSKPKQDEFREKKFGIYKALNTGLMLTSGDIITILMDYAWVPPQFVERTIEFYKEHPMSFLAYPEIFFGGPDFGKLFYEGATNDNQALWLWADGPMKLPPSKLEGWGPYFKRPEDVLKRKPGFEKQQGYEHFWEMSFATAPWSAYEALNGVDESLDDGDDCHEVNVRYRAEMIGYDLWIDGQSVVEHIPHRAFSNEPKWHRFAKDANWERFMKKLNQIRSKQIPVYSLNHFNLTMWREMKCQYRVYGRDCINIPQPTMPPPAPPL